MTATRSLLRDLRLQGVRLATRGDRVHVEAPTGVVSPDAGEQLAAVKAEVLAQLTVEEQFIGMSCSEFGRRRFAVELRIPGVDGTIWLAPQPVDAARLVAEGICRGRILTACELADLLSIETITSDDFKMIARLRVAFGAEIVEVTSDVDSSTAPRHG
jgi:hypothetical protein